jgi:hypothetical protein
LTLLAGYAKKIIGNAKAGWATDVSCNAITGDLTSQTIGRDAKTNSRTCKTKSTISVGIAEDAIRYTDTERAAGETTVAAIIIRRAAQTGNSHTDARFAACETKVTIIIRRANWTVV